MESFRGIIIYPRDVARHGDNAFGWLAGEAARCGMTLEVMFAEDLAVTYGPEGGGLLHRGRKLDRLPDFALMRTYDDVLSLHLESLGIPTVNSTEAMRLCKNKMLSHQKLVEAGLPTPRTLYVPGNGYDFDAVAELLGSPRFIVKRIDGAKGEGVYLVDGPREAADAVARCGGQAICQEFVAGSCGRDVRVWVIGGRTVGAVLRYSRDSFLSNYSQGGSVAAIDLPDEAARLAEAAAAAVGADFAGIDLLFAPDGFTVNEINGNAGFRTLSRVGDNPLPARLMEWLHDTFRSDRTTGPRRAGKDATN